MLLALSALFVLAVAVASFLAGVKHAERVRSIKDAVKSGK